MFKYVLFTIFLITILTEVSAGGKMSENKLTFQAGCSTAGTAIKKVAGKKIYFGHQSVGFNIMDGIGDIVKDNPSSALNIVKTNDPLAFKAPVFAHSTIGENDDPAAKMNDFTRSMDKGIGNNADIAFFKFCHIDIHRNTDIEKVFSEYKKTMDSLKNKYPKTRFVHVTVSLTVSHLTVKSLIKRLLGRDDNNIKRNQFNEWLLQEYAGKDPIFDLAGIESTYPDGTRSAFTKGGKKYYSLVPEYTDDGGHLNEKGRRIVAGDLLKFLSTIDGNK